MRWSSRCSNQVNTVGEAKRGPENDSAVSGSAERRNRQGRGQEHI